MIRATQIHSAGSWSQAATDTVVLEFDDRHRRRSVMNGVQGLAFLLDLDEAVMLRGGDALELEDGRLVEVVSAPERLMEVRARSPGDLLRLAWHIGNRHLPAQLLASAIRLREDHVIEQMLRGLGAKITSIEGPFDPEGGAYAARGGQSHRHGADETDDHSHHEHAHAPHHDHGGKHDHHHDHGSAAHDRSVAKHHHDH